MLKLQMFFFVRALKSDKANTWIEIFCFLIVAAFLLYFHCCLFGC